MCSTPCPFHVSLFMGWRACKSARPHQTVYELMLTLMASRTWCHICRLSLVLESVSYYDVVMSCSGVLWSINSWTWLDLLKSCLRRIADKKTLQASKTLFTHWFHRMCNQTIARALLKSRSFHLGYMLQRRRSVHTQQLTKTSGWLHFTDRNPTVSVVYWQYFDICSNHAHRPVTTIRSE